MEKIPGLRTIGNASDTTKEIAKKQLESKLNNHFASLSEKEKESLAKFEKQKTEDELAVINLINQEINRLRRDFGLDEFVIPEDNYHILDESLYREFFGSHSTGQAHPKEQGIVMNEEGVRNSLILFAGTAIHESLHLNGHITLEVNEGPSGETLVTPYRQGFSVFSPQKKDYHDEFHSHFHGLHEAVVARQEKESLLRLIENPLFSKDKNRLFSESALILKREIADHTLGLTADEIQDLREDSKHYFPYSYRKHREVLNFVCDKIYEKFPEEFTSQDAVFKLFLKAQFTGQLLDVARLVEGVFGKDSFRRLGDMETTSESAIRTLEALKKLL